MRITAVFCLIYTFVDELIVLAQCRCHY
ncbi:MAG: hypothetical protein B7Y68_07990 [Thiotrichales bacterium 35-46-9]|nr:MAG: hypothetical protein B7Y68_07990 [Thiotrichales bacterium 35-46-9]